MNNKQSALVTKELKGARLVAWTKSVLAKFKLHKNSRAAIIVNKNNIPQLFIFDTPGFLDVLSTIDEALVDRLSDEEYSLKSSNPAGWLIDELEARLPLNPEYIQSLKDAIEEAREKGWIPFAKIQKNLCLK